MHAFGKKTSKVCSRKFVSVKNMAIIVYVVPGPFLTPSINCSSSPWSVESNSAEANVFLAKHSIART